MYYPVKSRITKFMLSVTTPYVDQVLRPYTAVLDGSQDETINNMATSLKNANKINKYDITNSILQPSTGIAGNAFIPNGWGSNRFRFLIEVSEIDHFGIEVIHHFIGYTDKLDTSYGGNIAPDTVFYINAYNSFRRTTIQNPLSGAQNMSNVLVNSNQVLCDNNYSGQFSQNQIYRMAPTDVVEQLNINDLIDNNTDFQSTMAFNLAPMINSSEMKTNSRLNNLPSDYIIRTVDGFFQSSAESQSQDVSEVRSIAQSKLREDIVTNNNFLRLLKNKSINGDFSSVANSFRMSDLLDFDPDVTNVVTTNMNYYQYISHNNMAHWSGRDNNTIAATIIKNALPTYMLNYGFISFGFRASNENFITKNQIFPIGERIACIDPYSTDTVLNTELLSQAISGILRDISKSDMINYEIDVKCDLLGDINIAVRTGIEIEHIYVAPSWADALTAPTVANDPAQLRHLSTSVNSLFEEIQHVVNPGDTYDHTGSYSTVGSNPFPTPGYAF